MKNILYSIALLALSQTFAQTNTYARSILDTLCSPRYDGRGIYNNGEKRAATFIASEFQKLGVKPIGNAYFQSFEHSANAIIAPLSVQIGGKRLVPGEDYLIHPSSPTFDGKAKMVVVPKEALTDFSLFIKDINNYVNAFVVIDHSFLEDVPYAEKVKVYSLIDYLKNYPYLNIAGLVELQPKKLTHTASQDQSDKVHIQILKKAFANKNKKLKARIQSNLIPKYQSQNVIGYLEGKQKDSVICVVGHYDHLGRMGEEVYFPGANDNASGIAMILSLAKTFAQDKDREKTIVFMCFGSEEIGLLGSQYYVEHPLFPLSQIQFLINLDILGTGEDGIKVVNGKLFKENFDKLVTINQEKELLKAVKIRGAACNSDHCFFHANGVPSFFIYTLGGLAHYHDVYDASNTLPLTEFQDLHTLLAAFIKKQ